MSTNEQFAPNEDNLAMVQWPSTITILYTIIALVCQSTILTNFSEKEGMMEYVYQYDNLQRQLQLLQYDSINIDYLLGKGPLIMKKIKVF